MLLYTSFFNTGGGGTPAPPDTSIQSFANPLGWGDRSSSITVTTTATLGAGSIGKLVDGTTFVNDFWWHSGQSGRVVKFDFGVGNAPIIDGLRWIQSANFSHGNWVVEGSTNDADWAELKSSFALSTGVSPFKTVTWTNATSYRYYRLRQVRGTTSSSPWLYEIEFRVNGNADTAASGDRTSAVAITTTATMSLGTVNNLIDGLTESGTSESCSFTNGESTREVKVDFGAGNAKIVTGFRWYQHNSTSHGTWVAEGSNNDADWDALGSSFTLGGAAHKRENWANTTAYRYFRIRQTAGTTSSGPWLIEWEFEIAVE